jgi:hypothetical protein
VVTELGVAVTIGVFTKVFFPKQPTGYPGFAQLFGVIIQVIFPVFSVATP